MKTLHIKVKPNSRQQKVEGEDNFWTVYLKSSPVKGKANAELIELLANSLEVPESSIQIRSGHASRFKRIEIRERFE